MITNGSVFAATSRHCVPLGEITRECLPSGENTVEESEVNVQGIENIVFIFDDELRRGIWQS